MRARRSLGLLAWLICATNCFGQAVRLSDFEKAVVPVVYPLERAGRTATGCERIRYTFFGNAFFVGCDGLLLTAAHVLEPFAKPEEISVLLRDERRAAPGGDCWRLVPAHLIAQNRDADLAVLQVEPAQLGGQAVEYLTLERGTPGAGATVETAVFKPGRAASWTDGAARIETRRGQILKTNRKHLRAEAPLIEVYLISAPVVQGESGAPLYDPESGAVVGIVSGMSTSGAGAAAREDAKPRGAAVPVSYARPLLSQASCTVSSR